MKPLYLLAAAFALFALLVTSVSAQPPGGFGGKGGPPSYDKLLDAFDDNEDGELSDDEVPAGVWRRLGLADTNEDGVVTRKEFDAYRAKLKGGK